MLPKEKLLDLGDAFGVLISKRFGFDETAIPSSTDVD